jgi:hypothetical protein
MARPRIPDFEFWNSNLQRVSRDSGWEYRDFLGLVFLPNEPKGQISRVFLAPLRLCVRHLSHTLGTAEDQKSEKPESENRCAPETPRRSMFMRILPNEAIGAPRQFNQRGSRGKARNYQTNPIPRPVPSEIPNLRSQMAGDLPNEAILPFVSFVPSWFNEKLPNEPIARRAVQSLAFKVQSYELRNEANSVEYPRASNPKRRWKRFTVRCLQ